MQYLKTHWIHNEPDEPVWIYSELDADRWEVEDRQCQQKIDAQMGQKQALEAKLTHTYYSPEYIRDVKAACAKISEGMSHFTQSMVTSQ